MSDLEEAATELEQEYPFLRAVPRGVDIPAGGTDLSRCSWLSGPLWKKSQELLVVRFL